MKKGKKKRLLSWNRKGPVRLAGAQGQLEPGDAAFTLVELLLTVVLILLLFAAAVFNFGSWRQGANLNEGVARLETFIRLGRAHAAETGCKVQLFFAEATTNESSTIQLLFEPEPLAQPGVWTPLSGRLWDVATLNEMIRVVSVRSEASPAVAEPAAGAGEESAVPAPDRPPIIFYPDGTSDSAEITIAARDLEDPRRLAVQIIGFTGALSHRSLSQEGDAPLAASAKTPEARAPTNE